MQVSEFTKAPQSSSLKTSLCALLFFIFFSYNKLTSTAKIVLSRVNRFHYLFWPEAIQSIASLTLKSWVYELGKSPWMHRGLTAGYPALQPAGNWVKGEWCQCLDEDGWGGASRRRGCWKWLLGRNTAANSWLVEVLLTKGGFMSMSSAWVTWTFASQIPSKWQYFWRSYNVTVKSMRCLLCI